MKLHVDRRIVLNLTEMAHNLRVSITAVSNWLNDGAPGKKVGNEWELDVADMVEWRHECAKDKKRGGTGKLDWSWSPDVDDPKWPGEVDPAELREAAKLVAKRNTDLSHWLFRLADYLDPDEWGKG